MFIFSVYQIWISFTKSLVLDVIVILLYIQHIYIWHFNITHNWHRHLWAYYKSYNSHHTKYNCKCITHVSIPHDMPLRPVEMHLVDKSHKLLLFNHLFFFYEKVKSFNSVECLDRNIRTFQLFWFWLLYLLWLDIC